ncbi:MAG: GAF domain-containing protein, partial [Oscillospiraceae bacterium]
DGGTLYHKETDSLAFGLMFTRSNHTALGGRYAPIRLPPVPLSRKNVCSCAALDGTLINIADVYHSDRFDFSGPKKYDALTGYQTTSMLVVPMEDDVGGCIGVLQLINALDETGAIIPFDPDLEPVIRSLASQTAICQVNMAYANEIQELMDSIVRVMSATIDAMTPYNANHTRNMVKYGGRFLDWLEETGNPWQFDPQTRRQFIMSVWLHDSGKITVPLQVMDKDSRLGDALPALLDRLRIIGLLDEVAAARGKLSPGEQDSRKQELEAARALILRANTAGFLNDETLAQVQALADRTYTDETGARQPWLTAAEHTALTVRKGTLTDGERHIMENHAVMTDTMLAQIQFPKNYNR